MVTQPTAARQCRDFRARVDACLSANSCHFSSLFPDCPRLEYPDYRFYDDCSALVRDVKSFLSSEVSASPEIQMAFQSIKKTLPASCRCMESGLIGKVASVFSSPPVRLPAGYLSFARRVTKEIFPSGIDPSLYESRCMTSVPSLSGCTDAKRADGGVLGSGIDHSSFLDVVFGRESFDPDDYCAELTVVQSAGKPRPLSKQPSEAACLEPLHKALYAQLSRRRWLHKGDVTSESLERAGFTSPPPGTVLTSGDYKSATDGLSIEVAEVILGTVLSNSVSVPDSVKKYAMMSLRPRLYSLDGHDFRATRGQQMGSFLSFPLLCLQNYIAFRYAAYRFGIDGRKIPVSINGDDILFLSSPAFSSQWMSWMPCLGLEVETSKTSVSSSYGSLNSTLVAPRGDRLVVVPTVRMGMLKVDEVADLSAVFRDFVAGHRGSLRFRMAHSFFRENIVSLRGTCFTTYELGFRGRLAERMTERFGLNTGGEWCRDPLRLPPRFVQHNVTLSSDSVCWVPEHELSPEESLLCAAEMAAWRFSLPFSRVRHGAILYRVRLSMSRPTSPDFNVWRWSRTTTDWKREWRRMMRRGVERRPRCVPVRWEVYDQLLADRPPPAYAEELGFVPDEVAKDGEKK